MLNIPEGPVSFYNCRLRPVGHDPNTSRASMAREPLLYSGESTARVKLRAVHAHRRAQPANMDLFGIEPLFVGGRPRSPRSQGYVYDGEKQPHLREHLYANYVHDHTTAVSS